MPGPVLSAYSQQLSLIMCPTFPHSHIPTYLWPHSDPSLTHSLAHTYVHTPLPNRRLTFSASVTRARAALTLWTSPRPPTGRPTTRVSPMNRYGMCGMCGCCRIILPHPPGPPILFPDQAMRRIHAITADGRIVSGVEVFRLLYQAVGLGWVYAITRCGICVRHVLNKCCAMRFDNDPTSNVPPGQRRCQITLPSRLQDSRCQTSPFAFSPACRIEPVGSIAEALYNVWAKYR